MSITLSNDATVTLTVVADAPTTLKGTYTISASDNDASDLTIAQYTALTAVDISGNALGVRQQLLGILLALDHKYCCRYCSAIIKCWYRC